MTCMRGKPFKLSQNLLIYFNVLVWFYVSCCHCTLVLAWGGGTFWWCMVKQPLQNNAIGVAVLLGLLSLEKLKTNPSVVQKACVSL